MRVSQIVALKKRFNEYQMYATKISFNHAKILSKNNEQVKKIYEYLNSHKIILIKSLAVLKSKLIRITIVNSEFYVKEYKQLIEEIKNDFSAIEEVKTNIKTVSSHTDNYFRTISDTLLGIVVISDQITEFYQLNLASKYKNVAFTNMILSIREKLKEISEYIAENTDKDRFIKEVGEINQIISHFFSIVIQTYVYDKVISYLEYVKKRLIELEGVRKEIISENENIQIQQSIIIGIKALEDFKVAVRNLNTVKIKELLIVASKNLESSLIKIELCNKTRQIIDKDIEIIRKQINILRENSQQLFDSFEALRSNIGTCDNEIMFKIEKAKNDIKSFVFAYNNMEKIYSLSVSANREDIIDFIKSISNAIVVWKNNIDRIVCDVEKKYTDFIFISNQMAVNKLIISQLKGIKNTYNNQDVGTFIILNNLSKRIDEISNRLAVSYSQNYVESKNELLDIKNELMKLIESGAVDTNIYKYLQKVLFFANKYRYEDENIKKKIEMSERMIEEKKYANALDNLISLLEQIKSSAETNNVAFK